MKIFISNPSFQTFARTFSGVLATAFLLSLFACASQNPEHSGFLSEYDNLVASSKHEGLYVYRSEESNLSQYSKIYMGQVIAFLSKKGREREIDPTEINALTDYFRNELIEALKGKYILVGFGQRRPGTLHIKVAITDLKPTSVSSSGSTNIRLGGASAEFEFTDYKTGAVVLRALISEKGSRQEGDMRTWDNTRDVLKKWAGMLRESLDDEQNK